MSIPEFESQFVDALMHHVATQHSGLVIFQPPSGVWTTETAKVLPSPDVVIQNPVTGQMLVVEVKGPRYEEYLPFATLPQLKSMRDAIAPLNGQLVLITTAKVPDAVERALGKEHIPFEKVTTPGDAVQRLEGKIQELDVEMAEVAKKPPEETRSPVATSQKHPEKVVTLAPHLWPLAWAAAATAAVLLLLAIVFWPRKSPGPQIAHRTGPEGLAGAAEFLQGKSSRTEPQIAIMGNDEPKRTYGWRQETLQFTDRSAEQSPILELGFDFDGGNVASQAEANRRVAKQLALLIKDAQTPGARLEVEVHVEPADSETEETARARATRQAEKVRVLLAAEVGDGLKLPRVVPLGSEYFKEAAAAMKISPGRKTLVLLVKRWGPGGE